jgi:hypothetical protein
VQAAVFLPSFKHRLNTPTLLSINRSIDISMSKAKERFFYHALFTKFKANVPLTLSVEFMDKRKEQVPVRL